MRIEDGTGRGYKAKVDKENRLETNAVSQSVEHYTNFKEGTSYSMIVQQTPTGAGDVFVYMKNTGEIPLVVEGFQYRVASAEQIDVYLNQSGTPSGGSAVTIANLNSGSSSQPVGTFEAGNNITGLSNGTKIYKVFCTSTETKGYNFDQDVIIQQGGVLTFVAVAGSIQIDLNIDFYESET